MKGSCISEVRIRIYLWEIQAFFDTLHNHAIHEAYDNEVVSEYVQLISINPRLPVISCDHDARPISIHEAYDSCISHFHACQINVACVVSDLGIEIDSSLKYDGHINRIVGKAYSRIGVLF